MAKRKKIILNTKEVLEIWNRIMRNKDFTKNTISLPTFTKSEFEMMTWLLFNKPEEFRVWIIKKCDKRAIKQFIQEREAQRRGIPLKMSSIYLRRMKFLKEFIEARFNAAEAARRCGYSWKYAKQIGYRIRRNLY
jgi:hypothetical protein